MPELHGSFSRTRHVFWYTFNEISTGVYISQQNQKQLDTSKSFIMNLIVSAFFLLCLFLLLLQAKN